MTNQSSTKVEKLFRLFIIGVCITLPTVLSVPIYGGKRYVRSGMYLPQRNLQWTPLPLAAYQPRVTRYYNPYSQDYSVEDYYPQSVYYYQPRLDDTNFNYYLDNRPAGYYTYEQDPFVDEQDEKFDDYEMTNRNKPLYGQRNWYEDGSDDTSDVNQRFVQNLIDSQILDSESNSGTVVFGPAQSSHNSMAFRRREDDTKDVTYGTKKLSRYSDDEDSDEEERELMELKSLARDKKTSKKLGGNEHDSFAAAEKNQIYGLPKNSFRSPDWMPFLNKKNALKPLPPLSKAHPDLFDNTPHRADRKLNHIVQSSTVATAASELTTVPSVPVKKGQKELAQVRPFSVDLEQLALARSHSHNPSVIDTIKSLLSLEDSLNKVEDSGRPKKRSLVTSEDSLAMELGALRKKEAYYKQ